MGLQDREQNDQSILEAKANIDIAKMMNALDSIKSSTEGLSVYTLESMEKWFKEAMKFINAMQELKKVKDCVFNEAKIAKDIVNWIKSKSMYLEKIQELKTKLEATTDQNLEYDSENRRLKRLLVNFIEKFEIWQEEIDIEFIKRELLVNTKPIREIQEWAWTKFIKKLPEDCKIDQNPF